MAFRFGLQAVLHFRESVEHQQGLRAANQQVGRVQHLIGQMDLHCKDLQAARGRDLSAGLTAAELRFALQREGEVARHRRELELQLGRLQQLRDQQRELLRQARQARETLEEVREGQRREYEREAARPEQRSLDDLYLMRLRLREGLKHG